MRTTTTTNIHCNDETSFDAQKVTNFVTLNIGESVDLFLMNADQAAKLALAAAEAISLLRAMEHKDSTSQMFEAGKAWIKAIYDEREVEVHDFSATLGWDLADWRLVLHRSGSSIVPTKDDVDAFHAKYTSLRKEGPYDRNFRP